MKNQYYQSIKSIVLAVTVLFMCGKAYCQEGHGTLPTYYEEKLWISSVIVHAQPNVLLASGPIVLGGVDIASKTMNLGGANWIQFFDSTSPVFGSWVSTLTPKIALNGIATAPAVDASFMVFGSSYVFMDKRGTVEISIKYDWFNASKVHPTSFFMGYPKK